ncbi:Uncharacterised protein [Bordetella pertussis]|nr:Uncharacterised protein [Bordetella pertussis]
MVRYSLPSTTLACWRRRSRSCAAGSSTKSISPDSSAAVRVAFCLIGVKTTSVTLPIFLSLFHHSVFSTNTVRTSTSRDFSL